MFDLRNFTLKEMTACGAALRKLGADAENLDEAAAQSSHYISTHTSWTARPANRPVRWSASLRRIPSSGSMRRTGNSPAPYSGPTRPPLR